MKRFISFLACLTVIISVAQNNAAKLIYKNGTSVEGYAKLISKNRVKFKVKKQSKPQKIAFSLLDKVIIYKSGESYTYKEISIKNRKSKRIVLLVTQGEKVALFSKILSSNIVPFQNMKYKNLGNNKTTPRYNTQYTCEDIEFYVKRPNESKATPLTVKRNFKNFKTITSKYFNDCPTLVNKINSGNYSIYDITSFVNYYNIKCN